MCRRIWLLCCMPLLLTGCWDKVEINDMAFVIAMGIDVEDEEYVVTYVFPNLPVYTGQAEGESMFVRTVKDETMAGAMKKLAAQMNKTLNLEHLEAMVVGVELLGDTEKTDQLMDYLGRSSEFPRRIPVLAAADPAGALRPGDSSSDPVGAYIRGIYDNNQSVIQNYKLVLQDVLTAIEAEESLVIPVLHASDGILGISNGLVYDDQPLGVLSMDELEALSWLRESAEGMEYAIELDAGHVSLEIDEASCDYTYQMDQGKLSITANIETTMQVKEYQTPGSSLLDDAAMAELENQAGTQLKKEAEAIVEQMQNQYGVDLVSFLDPLKFKNRQLYLEEKGQWNTAFAGVEFQARAKVVIEKIGIKE